MAKSPGIAAIHRARTSLGILRVPQRIPAGQANPTVAEVPSDCHQLDLSRLSSPIVYRTRKDAIEIVSITHAARLLPSLPTE